MRTLPRPRRAPRLRRGAASLYFGFMLPLFFGLAAMSVDLSVVAVARSQLSTASDAAALAGAIKLADDYRLRGITDLSAEIAAANTAATSFAQANSVLGQAPVIVQNAGNSAAGDIVVGYVDPNDTTAALDTSAAVVSKYNAVQVTASRTGDHGGLVPAYFSRLMGFQGSSVQVMGTAIVQNYTIGGFKSGGGANTNDNANLLPIALKVDMYNAMMNGTTGDQYTWDPATKTITSGADGSHESATYPVETGSSGSWGTINIGVTSNSASVLGSQIRNGITPSQLATFPNSTIALDSTQSPPSITFSGDPGLSAGIKDDLLSVVGKAVTLPIYDTNDSSGNTSWFRVIAFAPVRIMSVNFEGSNKYVIVQPALVDDPTAIPGTAQTSWTKGGLIVLHLAR